MLPEVGTAHNCDEMTFGQLLCYAEAGVEVTGSVIDKKEDALQNKIGFKTQFRGCVRKTGYGIYDVSSCGKLTPIPCQVETSLPERQAPDTTFVSHTKSVTVDYIRLLINLQ